MHKKPIVGVSRCLLGDAVRYDSEASPSSIVIEDLSELFELVPVCPEVEAGLSVPREPVQLSGSVEQPRLTGCDDDSLDVTDLLQDYCASKPSGLTHLHGFIFKSRSPSCGLNSTPVFIEGKCVTQSSRGIFARALTQRYPSLPVVEETELEPEDARNRFIQLVKNQYARNT